MSLRPLRLRSGGAVILVAVLGLLLVPSGPAEATAGDGWRWPLRDAPAVERGFEPPPGPYAAGHRGVDLRAAVGAAVVAAASGTVTFTGSVAGRRVIVVTHAGGLRTTYEPVAATVAQGTPVAGGDELGNVVAVGSHCLPLACLHWGLRRGETYLDPLSMLTDRPVLLLPLWAEAQHPSAARRSAAARPARSTAPARPQAQGPDRRGSAVTAIGVSLLIASAAAARSGAPARRARAP